MNLKEYKRLFLKNNSAPKIKHETETGKKEIFLKKWKKIIKKFN